MKAMLVTDQARDKHGPMHPNLTDAEQDFVVEVLREAIEG